MDELDSQPTQTFPALIDLSSLSFSTARPQIRPVPVRPALEVRTLTPEEIQSVEHIFLATGNPLPNPSISRFIGAVEGGLVRAFLVLQVKLHAEPMWIEPGWQHLFRRLVLTAEQEILSTCGPSVVYMFAPFSNPKISQLGLSMGMQIEPNTVLSKFVGMEPMGQADAGADAGAGAADTEEKTE